MLGKSLFEVVKESDPVLCERVLDQLDSIRLETYHCYDCVLVDLGCLVACESKWCDRRLLIAVGLSVENANIAQQTVKSIIDVIAAAKDHNFSP